MNVSSAETSSVLEICISSHYFLMEDNWMRLYLHLFFYFKEEWLDHNGGGKGNRDTSSSQLRRDCLGDQEHAWSMGDLSIIHLFWGRKSLLLQPDGSAWGGERSSAWFFHPLICSSEDQLKHLIHHNKAEFHLRHITATERAKEVCCTALVQKQSPEFPEINDSTFPLNDLSQCRTWLAAEEMKDHSAAA